MDLQMEGWTDRGRQTGRQAGRQTDRQAGSADRQFGRQSRDEDEQSGGAVAHNHRETDWSAVYLSVHYPTQIQSISYVKK